jgi:MoaA/NifB/PqqE/SkfB family radical SAM enzyme
MCYQAAGPKGSDIRGDAELDIETIQITMQQAIVLPNLQKRVHLSGGETFLNFSKAIGFERIGTTTNAFWAVNRAVAEHRTRLLAEAGLNYFEVSIDFWHLPYVKVERVRNLLYAARRCGVTVILRTLSSKRHHLAEILGYFEPADLLHVLVGNGRVHPVGRGSSKEIADQVYPGNTEGCCEAVLNLTVSPSGYVYPCCAGADMTTSLASGKVTESSLADIVFRMETDRMLRQLIHEGPATLVRTIEQLGYKEALKKDYTSICHLCWDIFRQDDLSGALREHFDDVHLAELSAVAASLS